MIMNNLGEKMFMSNYTNMQYKRNVSSVDV